MPANASTIEQLARAARKYAQARAKYFSYPEFTGDRSTPEGHEQWEKNAYERVDLYDAMQDRIGELLNLCAEMYTPHGG